MELLQEVGELWVRVWCFKCTVTHACEHVGGDVQQNFPEPLKLIMFFINACDGMCESLISRAKAETGFLLFGSFNEDIKYNIGVCH